MAGCAECWPASLQPTWQWRSCSLDRAGALCPSQLLVPRGRARPIASIPELISSSGQHSFSNGFLLLGPHPRSPPPPYLFPLRLTTLPDQASAQPSRSSRLISNSLEDPDSGTLRTCHRDSDQSGPHVAPGPFALWPGHEDPAPAPIEAALSSPSPSYPQRHLSLEWV